MHTVAVSTSVIKMQIKTQSQFSFQKLGSISQSADRSNSFYSRLTAHLVFSHSSLSSYHRRAGFYELTQGGSEHSWHCDKEKNVKL